VQIKTVSDAEKANREKEKLVKEKTGKGYKLAF
jgi:predicted DNA-binding WGR domain protein